MTSRDIVETLIDRLEASHPAPAFFSADEAAQWPDGALDFLTSSGLLQRTQRPSSLVCDGCECSCIKEVHVHSGARGSSPRGFLICNEPPDLGRVEVGPARLVQFRMTFVGLANFLRQALRQEVPSQRNGQNVIFIGKIAGRHGKRDVSIKFDAGGLYLIVGRQQIQACKALRWKEPALELDGRILRRLANRKEPRSSSPAGYVPDRTRQTQKALETAKRDKEIRAEVDRKQRETGDSTLEICRQLASAERFHTIKRGKKVPLSFRRLYRIVHSERN